MKRNKIRYKVNVKPEIAIVLTGRLFLQYRDDEVIEQAAKGDMLVYPQNEQLHSTRLGDYEATGLSGYFKVDVHDGKTWQPLLLNEIFPDGEHRFSKRERPIDRFALCVEILEKLEGKRVLRTYREHYHLEE